MFAIIRTGGKQYKIQPDNVITVERLLGEAGDVLTFDTVLMMGDEATSLVGHPFISGALVKATLLEQIRSEKIIVFKKRRRHNYRRKQGHRQNQTVLRILEISGPNGLKATGKISAKMTAPSSPEKKAPAKEVSESKAPSVKKEAPAPKVASPKSTKTETKVTPKKPSPKAKA